MLPNINLFHHPTSCIAVCWRLDDPDPFLQGPPIPQGGGGAGYHCSIVSSTYHYISYFALRYLIWSSFQYLILTCNLFQHTCFLHLILPVALLLAGWPPPLPRTHPFHRGEGGWCYDHDHGRGGGGGTPNLEHIYIYAVYIYIDMCVYRVNEAE